MKTLAVIDAEFSDVVEAAMVGARLAMPAPIKEVRPMVLASAVPALSPRDAYVEFLKSTALSIGKKAVIEWLVAQLPAALVTGLIGSIFTPILGFAVGKILEVAINETEIGAFFLYIDLRTSAQGRAFESAAQTNLDKQKSGTPEEKAQAEKELVDAFRAFIKFTN